MMFWTKDEDGVWWLRGKQVDIWICARMPYCDRGNWLAHIDNFREKFGEQIDAQDLWPRYYFDLRRAKLECEAWMEKRGQAIE